MKRRLTIHTNYMRNKDVISIWVDVDKETKMMIQIQPNSIVLQAIGSKTIMKELTDYTTPTWKDIELVQTP